MKTTPFSYKQKIFNTCSCYLSPTMDYKNRCRTCLGSDKEMRHIHSQIRIAGNDVHLTDILQNFYNFKVTSSCSYICLVLLFSIETASLAAYLKILIGSES